MKNTIILTGRLPMFEGKYTPANGDKKSRMNWAMNVQLNTKNENGYYDEALVNFTAWGYYADQLQQINSLAKDDATRKEFSTIEVTAKFIPGYKDKDGNIQNSASLDVSEFTFIKRLPQANVGDNAFAPTGQTNAPAGRANGPAAGPGAAGPGGRMGMMAGGPRAGMMPGGPGAVPTGRVARF